MKYCIPESLVDFSKATRNQPIMIALLLEMTISYLDGSYKEENWRPIYVSHFAPIKAEIDAANQKAEKKTLEQRKIDFILAVSQYEALYGAPMIEKFTLYWTEHNERGLKMRFETHKIFNIKLRLKTWHGNEKQKTNAKQPTNSTPIWRR